MTRSTTCRKLLRRLLSGLAVTAFWLAVWQVLYWIVAQEILLVSPVRAVMRLFSLGKEPLFWHSVTLTGLRVMGGFLCAVAVGIILAVFCVRSKLLYRLIHPLVGVVRSTPVASIIILALVWIATNRVPVLIAFLMVLPMMFGNVYTGIIQTDTRLLEMVKLFHFTPVKTLRFVYIPSVMPYFVTACNTGLGAAWKSVIAAEVIALPKMAVGRQIYNAKIYLETADLFAWTIAVVIVSILIEKLAVLLLGRLEKAVTKSGRGAAGHGH